MFFGSPCNRRRLKNPKNSLVAYASSGGLVRGNLLAANDEAVDRMVGSVPLGSQSLDRRIGFLGGDASSRYLIWIAHFSIQ